MWNKINRLWFRSSTIAVSYLYLILSAVEQNSHLLSDFLPGNQVSMILLATACIMATYRFKTDKSIKDKMKDDDVS